HRIDGVLELEDFTLHIDGDLAAEIAARDSGRHLGDVAHLRCQIAGHEVYGVGQVLPCAANAWHDRLAAQPAIGADLARHTSHFGGERAELFDHRVQRFLEQEDVTAHVHADVLRAVAVAYGC